MPATPPLPLDPVRQHTHAEGVVRVTDPRGKHTIKTGDGYWRTKNTEDPLGHKRSKSWGTDNNVMTATDAMGASPDDGNVTRYTYDSAFNPTTATISTGASATSTWVKKGSGYFPETVTTASAQKTADGYDASGNLLTSTDSTSGGTRAKWTYTYNPEADSVREPAHTSVAMRSGGSSQYHLADAQSSVIGLVDPTGKRTNTGINQPYRYTSTYQDPSGLYEMGRRYYAPNLGRSPLLTPPVRRATPASMRAETPSTRSTPPVSSDGLPSARTSVLSPEG